jgi:uncharacterized protein YbjT (DUF2867 family)
MNNDTIMKQKLKIAVIGGKGLIGTQLVAKLRDAGHDAFAASRATGVDAVTGEGLANALNGVQVVVDVMNSPSFEDAPVLEFFEKTSRNLVAEGLRAGLKHHVALSVVGVDRTPDSGYFRAKLVQEKTIQSSGLPYTILRATQFFEFIGMIAMVATQGQKVIVPPAQMQPIASADVVQALAEIAVGAPANRIVEIAGPERKPQDKIVEQFLRATSDPRMVVADPNARYFGLHLNDQTLTPGANPRLGSTRLAAWLERTAAKK